MSDAPAPRMRFNVHPAVSVKIRHPANSFGRLHDDGGFLRRFQDFAREQGWLLRNLTTGPGILDGVLVPCNTEGLIHPGAADDAFKRIVDWLEANNAVAMCAVCGAAEEEDCDESKHA